MEDRAGPTIGILSPYLAGHFFGSLISGVHRFVSERGGRLVAISTATLGADDIGGMPGGPLPTVAWDRVAGFVSVANAVPPGYLRALREAGKAVVTLSHHEPGVDCSAVIADNWGGTRAAVEHLLSHGHTRIAFVGHLARFDVQQRYAAYQATLREHGIEPLPEWFFPATDSLEPGGRYAAEVMVKAGLPCTAVMCGNDFNAIGVAGGLRQAGYRLPRDQAVVGFDNHPGTELLCPSLSSVSQRLEDMAAMAASLLLDELDGAHGQPAVHVVEAHLVTRESCGCLPWEKPAPVAEGPASLSEGPASLEDITGAGAHGPAEAADETALATSVLESAFARAARSELCPLELFELGQSCAELYALSPGHATFDAIVARAEHLVDEHCRGQDGDAIGQLQARLRLERCLSEVRLALSRAMLNERNEAYYELRQGIRDEHAISMDLLHGHKEDPRSLSWLSRTEAIAGVLGLWRQAEPLDAPNPVAALAEPAGGPGPAAPPGGREPVGAEPDIGDGPDGGGERQRAEALVLGAPAELDVGGTFDAAGHLDVPGARYPVASFPPASLLDRAGADNLVVVFPVRNKERYWGLLSVAVPISWSLLNRETVFEWEALLCEALSYQDAVVTLNERSRQLALSYERERRMAQVVKESEERYAMAARAANDGLWDWDLQSGAIFYSSRWKRLLGYPANRVGPSPQEWLGRAHPDDLAGLHEAIEEVRQGRVSSLSYEHRLMTADGRYRWFLCRGLAVPGGGAPATRMVGSLTDITERRSLEERLRHQALHDGLTGLPNRTLFLDRLSQAMATAKRRPEHRYAVLWLDLDGFKVLNDSLGHAFGDKLLVQVAERVRAHVRETDTAARFGGDEFALLLQDVEDLGSVGGLAQRLLDHLNEPYDLDGHRVVATASIGIATSTTRYRYPEDVLRDADIAMYKAKATERGTFATFDSSMHDVAMARLKTESELRDALELEQLELHYQPVVELASGRVRALEALARWRKPGTGLVLPLGFLPVAEESGLIVPLGRWVQETACGQLSRWQAAGALPATARISINLSNREFWNPRLLEQLDDVIAAAGTRPSCVVVEITEGVIMSNLEDGLRVLEELRSRGILVSIDDFGTGYSSLEALHRLPIDSLKIDRSFIAAAGQDSRAAELARTIVQMARNLGLGVIAEGVETAAQFEFLLALDCTMGQGYYFSAPMPGPEVGDFLVGADVKGAVSLS